MKLIRRVSLSVVATLVYASGYAADRVDSSKLTGKVLFGYQG